MSNIAPPTSFSLETGGSILLAEDFGTILPVQVLKTFGAILLKKFKKVLTLYLAYGIIYIELRITLDLTEKQV